MSNHLTSNQQDLCLKLLKVGGVRFGEFKLKLHDKFPEAPLSPIFIDLRVVQRYPEVKKVVIDVYEELVKPLSFDLLAGIPIAAVALTSSLADRLQVGMVTPRITTKTHGSGVKIDGSHETDKGKTVLLIDDLVTKADSKFEAVKVLEEFGYVVKDIVVIIDRQGGGKEEMRKAGYTLHAAFTLQDMLSFYQKSNKVTTSELAKIKARLQEITTYTKNNL